MTLYHNKYRIETTRLKGWDYSSDGSYFVTIKTFSARRINELRNSPGVPVWQSRFHDHVIRDEGELSRIRQYIIDNPQNWKWENSSDNQLLM